METIAQRMRKVGTYFGYFDIQPYENVNEDSPNFGVSYDRLIFHAALKRREFIAFGDLVYFMYINNDLVKVGKAEGAIGWAGRMNTYRKDPDDDATNKKIMDIMKEDYSVVEPIYVYAISVPRVASDYYCNLTDSAVMVSIPRAGKVETYLTECVEAQGEQLIFCNQKT